MGWPQFACLALMFVGVGMECAKHGTMKTGQHNGWTTAIASALILALLWFGGFFS